MSIEEDDELPDILNEERVFPIVLFGCHQAAQQSINVMNIDELINAFHELERYCSAPHERYEWSLPYCTVDLSLMQALATPTAICQRTPMNVVCRTHRITPQNLKIMWCRLVAHYFEWIAGVPDLRTLSDSDRSILVTRQLCKVICLFASFNTYNERFNGIIYGNGIYYDPNDNYDYDEAMRSFLDDITNIIQKRIIQPFKEVSLQRSEYLLMKLVVLFYQPDDMYLSDEGTEIVQRALGKYRTLLVDHIRKSFPHLSQAQRTDRIRRILSILPYLEDLSDVDDHHLKCLTVTNYGDLGGELTRTVHVLSRRV